MQEAFAYALTQEGNDIADKGSHEAVVWSVLPLKGQGAPLSIKDLKQKVGDETAKIGQGRAFKNGWIGKEGDGLVKLVRRRCFQGHFRARPQLVSPLDRVH